MADTNITGTDSGMGYYTPGYGATIAERLQQYQGKNVTVYVGEELSSISGMLHYVGANYVEVHRTGASSKEAILIPMQYISAVSVPLEDMSHRP